AVAVPIAPCILLVPSASSGGRPARINAGNTMSPPPPARVSRQPARMATPNRSTSKRRSISGIGGVRGKVGTGFDKEDQRGTVLHAPADVVSVEIHAVLAILVMACVLSRAWVLRQHTTDQQFELGGNCTRGFELFQRFSAEVHLKTTWSGVGIRCSRLGEGVGIGQVRFDVENRGAIEQIEPAHFKSQLLATLFDADEFNNGEAD